MTPPGPPLKRLLLALVVAAFALGTAAPTRGEDQAPEAVTSEEATAILMRMAEFLSKTEKFSVNVTDSYDTLQDSGEKIEFNETRKLTVVRPDRFRIDVEESDGEKSLILFDGKTITASTPSQNVYAQVAKPGTIDDAVFHFIRDLHMRLPFAPLMVASAPTEMRKRSREIDYVEKTSIFGKPAHHLVVRATTGVDYQIWIADGDKPLPQRLVLTYPSEPGQPQFRAQFSNWNLSPRVPASTFAFTPPKGAERISFLAQLQLTSVPGTTEPTEPSKSSPAK